MVIISVFLSVKENESYLVSVMVSDVDGDDVVVFIDGVERISLIGIVLSYDIVILVLL